MNNYTNLDFTKLKPCVYSRKSSESEDKQMLSISSQLDEASRISEYYKLQKFVEIFQESKSAKKEFVRVEFLKMIEMVKSSNIDSIVCWKLDRLARNMTEGGMLIDLLSSGTLKAIITHDKVYYPSDNVLLMSVEFGQGKQFVKDLSVNVKRGQTKKASMGIPHGVAALGFLNDKTEEKGNRKWLVDESKLPLIKILLERFLTGTYSAGKVYKYAINDLKLTTVKRRRTGGALITQSRIYEILKDPIYAGFFYQNNIRYELDVSLPRLISESQHNKIKMLLSRKNIPKTQRHEATYSGFMLSPDNQFIGQDVKFQVICDCKEKYAYRNKGSCPNCGIKLDGMKNPKYLSYTYYYNVSKKKSGNKYKSISDVAVNKIVSDFFTENLQFSPELVTWSKEYIGEMKEKEIQDKIVITKRKSERVVELQNKKAKLRSMYQEGKFTDEEYKEDLTRLEFSYKDTFETFTPSDWYLRLTEIVSITEEISKVLLSDNIQLKRNIFSKLGSNLVWDEEKLSIINSEEINVLINGIKSIKSEIPEFEPKNYIVNKSSKEKTDHFQPVFSTLLRG